MRITRSIVPNMFTLVNALSGFTAIVYISEGEYNRAALFILVAAIFDMLDGVMARLVNSTSEFGAELDSLCDAISFGVAPGYMLYKVYFHQFEEFGILLASLPALAGVVRLARFNVKTVSFEDKNYFTGLPIPSSALTIISYIIFYHLGNDLGPDAKTVAVFTITIVCAAAMVSGIKYDNMPRPTKKSISQRPIAFVIMIIGFIIFGIFGGKAIFPFMVFYIIVSAIRSLINWFRTETELADDMDENEEPEPGSFDI